MEFVDVIKMLFPLMLVLLLMFGVLYFIKKRQFSIGNKISSNFPVKVLQSTTLMPKKFVVVTRVGQKIMVLGVTESNISVLQELDNVDDFDKPNDLNQTKSFFQMFKDNLAGK